MRLSVLIGLFLLGLMAIASPDVDFSHETKLTYCSMLVNRRVYKEEKLDDFCSLKVQQWENQVYFKI